MNVQYGWSYPHSVIVVTLTLTPIINNQQSAPTTALNNKITRNKQLHRRCVMKYTFSML